MPNALIRESSLYLRQHAANPVDWIPWSEEVFRLAGEKNKPVLISIGYSSCHWCHVMEKECFEDREVADLMNRYFICVKADREEHPDVDSWYMLAVQLLGRPGGWPLNVFVMPDGAPFFGGTYFPKPHWINLLRRIAHLFSTQRQELQEQAENLKKVMLEAGTPNLHPDLQNISYPENVWEVEEYLRKADPVFGGEQRAPKFPMPAQYLMWMKYASAKKHEKLRQHLFRTLQNMASRGLNDVVQGGFFRYSTDAEWVLPHFEKMLYDNVQMLELYAHASIYYSFPFFRYTAERTAAFLMREMMEEKRKYFYSSIDADSEGEEGKYYLWTPREKEMFLQNTLPEVIELRDKLFVSVPGTEVYTLFFPFSQDLPEEKNIGLLNRLSELLFDFKKKYKVPPVTDRKMILSWNALAVRSFALAGWYLNRKDWIRIAEEVAEFIMQNMFISGTWYRIYEQDAAKIEAGSTDVLFLCDAYRVLFEVTGCWHYLEKSVEIMEYALEHFQDEHGFFLNYKKTQHKWYGNLRETEDNVIPSSNAVGARNLYYLGRWYDRPGWIEKADAMYRIIRPNLVKYPGAYYAWMELAEDYREEVTEAVFVGNFVDEMYRLWLKKHPVNANLLFGSVPGACRGIFENKPSIHDSDTLYICKGRTCFPPVLWKDYFAE